MLQGMDQSEFGKFVAALWERQGWQTQVKRDDGRTFVAVQRPNTGEEGLLWAIPDGEVGGKQVQQFAKLCKQYGVSESAIVTAGTVSDHANKVSQGSGVDLLDGEGVAKILKQKEWTDLAEQYGDGDGGGGAETASGGDGDSPLDQLQAVGDRVGAKLSGALGGTSIPTKPVIAVVVVVALLAVGVLSGVSVPFLGGGGNGPVSAESVAPENSTSTLNVTWNARVTDTIDPNESDGRAYNPPRGYQFVLVQMQFKNGGESSVNLTKKSFKFRTDERTYSHQPLSEHEGFMGLQMSPGTRYAGWMVFAVPEDSSGTLVYDQSVTGDSIAVKFTRDSNLEVSVSDR
ncbi:restriction endonuclease [Halorussus pelagicus]|uniref:restriction endonuclease n=1 Tax=Halorussus pelagicus TaxID=2505977 RepID=UPI000FFC888C|nr:restriction endonuclease [Halorussus pelagicus]